MNYDSYKHSLRAVSFLPFTSNSKSGSFSIRTGDKPYMVKTIISRKAGIFMNMLKGCSEHFDQSHVGGLGSMLTKFYGVYSVDYRQNFRHMHQHFVVMNDVFGT